ncbi:MAG TPA: helix-turn-helix transcriptional regulator [Clostridia bacterium]|nr:helix-turn-helix transcriptional regulator [Clostridia bacterium]
MSRMGTEISRLRKEVGLTQKQLAKAVGVTEGFISEVEAGRKVLNGDLLTRISKALHREVDKLDFYEAESKTVKPEPDPKVVRVVEKPVQEVWHDALSGVLKDVPVYDYKMDKAISYRKLPIIANKVEGFPKEKVSYLIIQDNDMAGFRMSKEDQVLAVNTQEIERDAFYLIEYGEKRMIRQVKTIGGDKLLLVSNKGSLATETVARKDIKILARLIRLEIIL